MSDGTVEILRAHPRTTISAVLATVFLIAVVAFALMARSEPLAAARNLAAEPSNFDTPEEVTATLDRVSERLAQAGAKCTEDHGDVPRCAALDAAALWAQRAAVPAGACSAPERRQVRAALVQYLDDIRHLEPTDVMGEIPRLPTCARPTVGTE